MNSQEFRSLSEAYLEVVENQQLDVNEIFGLSRRSAKDRLANSDYMKKKNKEADEKAIQNLRDMMSKDPERQKRPSRINNEQKDIYDIILSHLLDEGYAETPEAAEAIMVNMSEEWRDSIVEEKKPLPVAKMDAKAKELNQKFLKSKPGSPEAKKLISRVSQITGTRDRQTV